MSQTQTSTDNCGTSRCYPAKTVWTYFVQSIDGGPIKIGYTSTTPEERLSALQTGSPTKLRIVGLLPEDREKMLHKQFASDHSHGEWFHPSPQLLAFIDAEASKHLNERLVSQAMLNLEGRVVPVASVSRPLVSCSDFDQVFDNDETLWELLPNYCDWDEGDVWDGEGEPDEAFLVSNSIDSMCFLCADEQKFIQSVGVNEDAGMVGFICGPCNSRRRFEVLKDLADLVLDVDAITGRWWFFAVFWDQGRQVGIDLLALARTGGAENAHIFYPDERLSSG